MASLLPFEQPRLPISPHAPDGMALWRIRWIMTPLSDAMKPTFLLPALLAVASLQTVRAQDRPRLQIINGSKQTIDLFWLK